ncbi:type 4a pilus biogenesis protein PilO [Azoarcus sp. KH32C]|uniref:type 4a pilus biogenesis protein PilO n=1 Tax=Azoarcus sp. KH32C TaxID=748247 RepID=UPI0002386ACB|nr:type 4a pilus biogenesis protein PilO [Azoarcus sp. KH32C]BAL26498.1 type IV pilus assembly protein [Azoarcus sp. KH32C]
MKLGKSSNIDFAQLAQDFKGLDPNDPGAWPLAPRIAVFIVLLVGVVALAWWFDWRDQAAVLEQRQGEEEQLRQDWLTKKKLAVNLEAYKMQLEEIDRQFGALLKQLPNKAEMDSLLADINQAGLGRGLQFDLFKPGTEGVKDFYAEMPIDVKISGRYADLGTFAEDVAGMPRIVTLSDLAIEGQKDGSLKMDAKAITYRYLDEEELAQKRQQEKAAKAAKGGK